MMAVVQRGAVIRVALSWLTILEMAVINSVWWPPLPPWAHLSRKVGLFHFTHISPEKAKRTLNGNHHLGLTLCSLILVTLYFASISNVTHTTWTCYNSLITTEDEQYRLAVVNNTTDLATRKPIVCPLFIPYKSIKCNVVPRDCKQSRFCIIYFMLLLSGNLELNPGPGQ